MTSIFGLLGGAIAVAGFTMTVARTRHRRPAVRVGWLLVVLVLACAPIGGLVLAGYLRGLIGDLSVTTVVLAACAIITQLSDRDVFDRRNLDALVGLVAVAGVLLYPAALGLTMLDPYALGYGSPVLIAGLALLTLVAWLLRLMLPVICITLGALAALAGVYESLNLWDYLIDPALTLVAWAWVVDQTARTLWRRRPGARSAAS